LARLNLLAARNRPSWCGLRTTNYNTYAHTGFAYIVYSLGPMFKCVYWPTVEAGGHMFKCVDGV
jgi:hypothetical protein